MRCIFILLAILCSSGCSLMFPTEAGDHLPGFDRAAPALNTLAPNFSLRTTDGDTLTLHDLIGERPVVVQLGSYTCPVFRYRRFDLQPLRAEYGDRVHFVVVYTTEAHPVGAPSPYRDEEWVPWINRLTRVDLGQPSSAEERLAQARWAQEAMSSNAQFAVDGQDDAVWRRWGAAPSPAFVLDRDGQVVLRQAWVEPKALRSTLDALLEP